MSGKIYNEDAFDALQDIANECTDPIIVTDPPFNIGYHYGKYKDRKPEAEYYQDLAHIFTEYPSVVVLYPEALHRLSIEMQEAPARVVSWVYPSNTKRQHRDVAFYRVAPDFDAVRRPYKNPNDKRIRELVKRTGGGRSYDWLEVNQVKNISKEKTTHPCQMPLEVMRNIIGWLPRTATIIDPFAGSGTTALAAEAWGMEWRAIEIDADYCDIIAERVEAWNVNCTSSMTESYNVETAAS